MQTKTTLSFFIISFLTIIYCHPPPRHGPPHPPRHRFPSPPRWGPRPPPLNRGEQFKLFHKHFRRPYRYGSPEYYHRFNAFKKNIIRVEQLNKLRVHNSSAEYGVTKFSDLTTEEFKAKYLSGLHVPNKTHLLYQTRTPSMGPTLETTKVADNTLRFHPKSNGLPLKIDWRTKGVLTPVRDQGGCGGCWAFSVVEMTESVAAINNKKLVPLSVQEVIDCSNTYEHALWGCRGGDTCRALEWLQKTKTRLVPEAEYPLQDKPEACLIQNRSKGGVTVHNYTCSNLVSDEELLQRYISQIGPVSVSVDATTWNNYLGGIIQFHCGELPNNHAVIIVGYDKTGDIPYYIVKNSWGDDFGEKGYVYIAMGNNVCGIAHEVSTVSVKVLGSQ